MITPGGEGRFVVSMVRESVADISGLVGGTEDGGGEYRRQRKRRRIGEPESSVAEASASAAMLTPAPSSSVGAALEVAGSTSVGIPEGMERQLSSRWYMSMLGKVVSAVEVVDTIKELGVSFSFLFVYAHSHP